MRALCLHGHFYQPPREDPWLDVVEPEASAAPERDWNTRVTAECYAPNAAARVLDGRGRLTDLVSTYEWTSFDFGPTLLAWLGTHAADVLAAVQRADTASRARTGYGNAWAQAYGHAILPLSTPRDVRTQVRWGRADFLHRFGRSPDGMWLPEMAVDRTTLTALAEADIPLTMLAPHQAARVRPLGAGADAWRDVTPETLDTSRLYRYQAGPGLAVDVVFRHAGLSEDVAFGRLLTDGAALVTRLRAALEEQSGPALVTVAVDGETFGHHHRFGEMALAWALRALAADPTLTLVGPAAFRARHPAVDEVEIIERTSWSCPHGIERWRADCGCAMGGDGRTSQAWRTPLRRAIDWLRDELATLYEARAGEVLRDPWGARDRYVDCLLAPERTVAFLAAEAAAPLSAAATLQARRALEMTRHALLMQTSCGWFFDELTRIEPVLILRHAARAIELAEALGARPEEGLVARLEPAASGAALYRRAARGAAATPARVAATGALLTLLGEDATVPGYEVSFSAPVAGGRLEGGARVLERVTGAVAVVPVVAEQSPGTLPTCRVEGERFTLAALFGVQRERLLVSLAGEAAAVARSAGRDARARIRPVLDALLQDELTLPLEIAALLGWEQADVIAAAVEERKSLAALIESTRALRRRGVRFPARWLAPRIARALETELATPAPSPERALALLDLAMAADVPLDLARAQVLALAWWHAQPSRSAPDAVLRALGERLGLAPEDL